VKGEDISIEDLPVLAYSDEDRPDVSVAVPFGNLLCRGIDNLLLGRAAETALDQVPLLLAVGEAAGRAAAQAVLYDGCISKLEPDRLRKAFISDLI
jgi:hypothetical protein